MPEVRFIGGQAADGVTPFHRSDSLLSSKIMQDHLVSNLKIVPGRNGEILEPTGDDSVTCYSLCNTITGTESTLDATGLFIAIGLFFTIGRGPRSALVV